MSQQHGRIDRSTARAARTPERRPRTTSAERTSLKLLGAKLKADAASDLAELVKQGCDHRPGADLTRDVTRGRAASDETFFAALAAVVRVATPAAIGRFAQAFYTRMMALNPAQQLCLTETLYAEIEAQAAADIQQQMFRDALYAGDQVKQKRCIEAVARHIHTLQQFHQQMLVAMQSQGPKPKLTILPASSPSTRGTW
jgi:hypothetical protein